MRRAFRETSALNPVHAVGDGDQAIQYLAGEGKYADRAAYPFPALFLLDLKMPVKDGLEVLRWLHEHPDIPSKLPVVVLSSAELPTETQMAYAMDIQACIVKPLELCRAAREDSDPKGVLAGLRGRGGLLKAKRLPRSSRWSAARFGRCGRGL